MREPERIIPDSLARFRNVPAGSSKNYSATQEGRLFAKLQAELKNLMQPSGLPSQARLRRAFREPFPDPRGGPGPPGVDGFLKILPLPAEFPKKQSVVLPLCISGKKEFIYLLVLFPEPWEIFLPFCYQIPRFQSG